MNDIFKWLRIPTGDTKEVKAYESWIVRYNSAVARWTDGVVLKEQAEVFTTEADANDFAKQLRAANKFAKNAFLINIRIEKN